MYRSLRDDVHAAWYVHGGERHWHVAAAVGSDIVTGKKWYTYHANRPHHAKVPANDARSLEAYQLYHRPPPASGPVASPAVNANIESAAIESEL